MHLWDKRSRGTGGPKKSKSARASRIYGINIYRYLYLLDPDEHTQIAPQNHRQNRLSWCINNLHNVDDWWVFQICERKKSRFSIPTNRMRANVFVCVHNPYASCALCPSNGLLEFVAICIDILVIHRRLNMHVIFARSQSTDKIHKPRYIVTWWTQNSSRAYFFGRNFPRSIKFNRSHTAHMRWIHFRTQNFPCVFGHASFMMAYHTGFGHWSSA